MAKARQDLVWAHPREGKPVALWSESVMRTVRTQEVGLTRVYRATERGIDRHGQRLLISEWDVDGWDTSLPDVTPEQVIALYANHGTHEQFHREFKTDLDLERLPSGKFDTIDTILSLAAIAYNCLRLIGQQTLLGDDAPIRTAPSVGG